MWVRTRRNWNPPTLLVRVQNSAAALENSFTVLWNVKHGYHVT